MKAIENRVFLNASMVTRSPTGVGIYSKMLIKHLTPLLASKNINYTIYTYDTSAFENCKNVKRISLGALLDKLLHRNITLHRHLWNIVYLRFIAIHYSLIFSPSSHGTLNHKNQIITIHDLISLAYPKQHKGQYVYFKKYIPLLIKKSKHVITISNFTRSEVLKNYDIEPAKTTTIYNGVDHLENVSISATELAWAKSVTKGKPFCLVVGASYFHKNADTVLKMAEQLQNKEILFVLIGTSNQYFTSLISKASTMNLSNIIFLEYVSEEKLAALYKLAKLNLYISLYEGFGFPPAEALSFGTRSILSTQSALSEVYKGFAYFVDPLDIYAIEKKISVFLLHGDQLSYSFSKLKKRYNWDKSAQLTFELLQQYL